MNTKSQLGLIVGGVIVCVSLGIFGWITVTGSSTERFLQLLLFLAPTLSSLFGVRAAVKAQQVAEETKKIVSPTNGEYKERALAAYTAYGDAVGWKNYQGSPMPKFEDLSQEQMVGWYQAVKAGNGETIS